jgi:hypothetical protein
VQQRHRDPGETVPLGEAHRRIQKVGVGKNSGDQQIEGAVLDLGTVPEMIAVAAGQQVRETDRRLPGTWTQA